MSLIKIRKWSVKIGTTFSTPDHAPLTLLQSTVCSLQWLSRQRAKKQFKKKKKTQASTLESELRFVLFNTQANAVCVSVLIISSTVLRVFSSKLLLMHHASCATLSLYADSVLDDSKVRKQKPRRHL